MEKRFYRLVELNLTRFRGGENWILYRGFYLNKGLNLLNGGNSLQKREEVWILYRGVFI